MARSGDNLTRSGLLVRNTAYNFLGQVSTLISAIICIPILIKELDLIRFGILTFVWLITGYFGIFDLGVGRALTKNISEKLGSSDQVSIPSIFWTGLLISTFAGIIGALLLFIISPTLVSFLKISSLDLKSETIVTMHVLSLSAPIIVVSGALVSSLAAYQRFDLINITRVPFGALMYLVPVWIVQETPALPNIAIAIVIVKCIEMVLNLLICLCFLPNLRTQIHFDRSVIRGFLGFGGWVTLGNAIGPTTNYTDRLLVGSVSSVSSLGFYTVPLEIVNRLNFIPSAFLGVFFPALANSFGTNLSVTTNLYRQGATFIFTFMLPIVCLVVTFAPEILTVWLGNSFAYESTEILRLLSCGALMTGLSFVPYALLHAGGRPDLTAKLHAVELIIFSGLTWLLTSAYGIVGAALSWGVRSVFDSVALFWMADRVLHVRLKWTPSFIATIVACVFLAFASMAPLNLVTKICFYLFFIAFFTIISWKLIFEQASRDAVREFLQRFAPSSG